MNHPYNVYYDKQVRLREAEHFSAELFRQAEIRGLIRSEVTEKQLNTELYDLAFEMYGIKRYWHKRIVRSGPNTIHPYKENPPDRVIQPDDILFFDFGPVFEEWEADFGRTYVLGSNPEKLRIQREVEVAWHLGKQHFDDHPDITGGELYDFVVGLAHERGWHYPQSHAGHLIGNFPHEKLQGDDLVNYIHKDNRTRMRDPDTLGAPRDWILEIHFVNRGLEFGGFFEQLLTIP